MSKTMADVNREWEARKGGVSPHSVSTQPIAEARILCSHCGEEIVVQIGMRSIQFAISVPKVKLEKRVDVGVKRVGS